MEIKQYAPVLIPTLNRYTHFRNCLESLEKCTGAEKTDVYIALDYPPSDKYTEGWKKINEYLKGKEQSNKFAKLVVIRRNHNFGVGGPNGNLSQLKNQIKGQYDRYILSEDDNIFSQNFLEYINKGLELYKDDMRILQVCGYNYHMDFPKSYKNNFYFSRSGSPWGYGTWTNRETIISKYKSLQKMGQLLKDEDAVRLLKKERPSTLVSMINMLKNHSLYGDSITGCVVTLEDMYYLMPVVSKVRNTGADGTGVHATSRSKKIIDFFLNQKIDDSTTFDFTDDIFTTKPINVLEEQMPVSTVKEFYKKMVFHIDYFLWRNFSFVPKSKYI